MIESIVLDKTAFYQQAYERVISVSGLDRPGAKYERMRKVADSLREEVEQRAELKIAITGYDDLSIDGETLTIQGQTFRCKAFSRLETAHIKRAYVYLLTAGNFACPERSMVDQVYYDFWGTAFVEEAEHYMDRVLSEESRCSEHFGPGYFGMPVVAMTRLKNLVDWNSVGVTVHDTGFIEPVKSSGGIIFQVDDDYKPLPTACGDCRGSAASCRLCMLYQNR